jgi:hypothetical protein
MTALTSPAGYALDSAWHAERERLDSLTSLYDPGTLHLCERLGLAEGWRCLDEHLPQRDQQVWADREQGLPQWELLVYQLAPGLLAAGLVTPSDLDAFHTLWHDGATAGFAPLMVSSWGRRCH